MSEISVTIEKVDPQWYPVIYYMAKAIDSKGREFSQGLIAKSQYDDFIQKALEYFEKKE